MALGGALNLASFAQEVANIVGITKWNVQEVIYNGALFCWMQPSYATANPAEGITQYIQNDLGSKAAAKPPYGTWSSLFENRDSIDKKLIVFPVPNYNGFYIDDFGLNGSFISMVGIVNGTEYLQTLDKCATAFLDSPSPTNPALGVNSKSNFRVLQHLIYGGPIRNVYLKSFNIITSSENFQAAAFQLELIASDPSYLTPSNKRQTWQQDAQEILDESIAVLIQITQTFSLGQSLVNSGSVGGTLSGSSAPVNQVPIINGTGIYLNGVIAEIQKQLANLTDIFSNSMAFLEQNCGGLLNNSYWDAIVVDPSKLPIYLAPGQAFTYSDAQVVIANYTNLVNSFISFANDAIYSYNIQNNIFALGNSIVALNDFSKLVLLQNTNILNILPKANIDLYGLMQSNNISLTEFANISVLNQGQWYSSLMIPAGISVNLIT